MNCWDAYRARSAIHGATERDRAKLDLTRRLRNQIPSTLSYHVLIVDGHEQNAVVLNSDNLNQKTICTLPGEDIRHGACIDWVDHKWLVTERDANTEIYTKAIMLQCNYLLRWVNKGGEIIERWCIVEDGTRYLTGEYTDAFFVATRGDSRISVTLPKDAETLALGRDARFIIDDYGTPDPLAYRLTKPFKLGGSFDDNGIVTFVMMECNTEQDDNLELHIADYYKYFPRVQEDNEEIPDNNLENTSSEEFRGWI